MSALPVSTMAALPVSTGRAGGVYMPPHRQRALLAAAAADTQSEAHQRLQWELLRKRLNGIINKVNTGNMVHIVSELFGENLVRGRGLFCRGVMKAQMASPGFTHIYAALVAIVNTKLPEIGELLLKRVIIQFRRSYKRNNKLVAVAVARFIAHLVNQQVAHELVALQMMSLLLEHPTDDSVEVAIGFIKEVGQLLSELTPLGVNAIFDRFRAILHEGDIDKRVQYMIEALFAVRKERFAEHPAVAPELDLVEREDQITHELALDDTALDGQELLDVFQLDPDYAGTEAMWAEVKAEVLGNAEGGADDDGEGGGGGGGGEDTGAAQSGGAGGGEGEENGEGAHVVEGSEAVVSGGAWDVAASASSGGGGASGITDLSETDLINLRRTIYLTIMSSLDFEECAHKLMKLAIPRGAEAELANMVIECCSQEKTFLRYFGLLGRRFCMISSVYQDAFHAAFAEQYGAIHRLETNKLRNVAKLFAYLLQCDALPWTALEAVRLNEEETTSASRIFVKILCQELSEYLGLHALRARLADAAMRPVFAGLLPTDEPRHTRFAINFFTSIGLGALTDDLRAHLKAALAAPPLPPAARAAPAAAAVVPAAAAVPSAKPAQKTAKGASGARRRRSRSRSSSDSSGSGSSTYSGSSYSSYSTSGTSSSSSRTSSSGSRSHSRSSSYSSRSSSRPRKSRGGAEAAGGGASKGPSSSKTGAAAAAAAAAPPRGGKGDSRRRHRDSRSHSRSPPPPRRALAPVESSSSSFSAANDAARAPERRGGGGDGKRQDGSSSASAAVAKAAPAAAKAAPAVEPEDDLMAAERAQRLAAAAAATSAAASASAASAGGGDALPARAAPAALSAAPSARLWGPHDAAPDAAGAGRGSDARRGGAAGGGAGGATAAAAAAGRPFQPQQPTRSGGGASGGGDGGGGGGRRFADDRRRVHRSSSRSRSREGGGGREAGADRSDGNSRGGGYPGGGGSPRRRDRDEGGGGYDARDRGEEDAHGAGAPRGGGFRREGRDGDGREGRDGGARRWDGGDRGRGRW